MDDSEEISIYFILEKNTKLIAELHNLRICFLEKMFDQMVVVERLCFLGSHSLSPWKICSTKLLGYAGGHLIWDTLILASVQVRQNLEWLADTVEESSGKDVDGSNSVVIIGWGWCVLHTRVHHQCLCLVGGNEHRFQPGITSSFTSYILGRIVGNSGRNWHRPEIKEE